MSNLSTRPSFRTLALLMLAACFGGVIAGVVLDGLPSPAMATPAPEPATPARTPMTASLPSSVGGQPLPSLAPMLARVTPAVVSVQAKQRVRVNNPFTNDPMFRRMFPHIPQERIEQSLGSGVIVDAG